jgi:hypothetical protein
VVGAKPDGATPGFVFETPEGQRYLAKLDGSDGNPRPSLAEVVASRLYHAAGYHVPCNSIAFFGAATLEIDPKAAAEDATGNKTPLTPTHIEKMLRAALRLPDGRHRALVSLYLHGRPLGPWRYHGVRSGDRNDIIPHEDRREIRASRLLAAWTDHVDQREGNTLAMWLETGAGKGFVMHHLLDFGDCFGSVWQLSVQGMRRRGHDYWLDPRTMLMDWATFGVISRPWDKAQLGPTGLILGYYDVEHFDPERWKPRYPNPAFQRMTEHDAAWMARIIARIRPSHLERIFEEAQVDDPLRRILLDIVQGRRAKLLERYLSRLSPLADPAIEADEDGTWLCATDLAESSGVVPFRIYRATAWFGSANERMTPRVRRPSSARICAELPRVSSHTQHNDTYAVMEFAPASGSLPSPIRFHLYLVKGAWLTAGIERISG